MDERWVPVVGVEDAYEVSDQGRVRSVERTVRSKHGRTRIASARVLKPARDHDGYLMVALSRGGIQRTRKVHVLVLESFVGPRPEGMQACHRDGVPGNNGLTNLRWDTPSANTYDQVAMGRHHKARRTECPSGHPYSPENTYLPPRGGRQCRTCRAISWATRRELMRGK